MKYVPSALVTSLSGKTGGVVASRWKGVGYIRAAVIPKMGMSAGQVAARLAFTQIPYLFRSLSTTLKDFLNTYGTPISKSGFNVFSKTNVPNMVLAVEYPLLPGNSYVPAPPAFAVVTGAGAAGTVEITWTASAIAGYTNMGIIGRLSTGEVFIKELLTTLDTAATLVPVGLTPGLTYTFWGFLYNPTTGDCGTTAHGTAAAHA